MKPNKAPINDSNNKNINATTIIKINTRVALATNTLKVGNDNFFNSGTAGLNNGIANKMNPTAPTIVTIQANNVPNPPITGVDSLTCNTPVKINKPKAIATKLKNPNK